jgi:DNA-binding transcriptional LysR family regulator
MHLDFHGLEAFVAIAERGSFRAAAAHLNLSQTALSHRIRKFEDGTGVALLNRTTRHVALTAAGADLLPRARRLLDDMAAATERLMAMAAQSEPKLAFGCLPTIATVCLPPVMNQFRLTYPDMQVRVFDDSASELADRVQSGDAAFAITVVAANRWNLDLEPLVREPFVLLCNRHAAVATKSVLNWADIVDLPLIRISTETGNRTLIDDALGNRREALNWRYEVQRVTTAVALVSSGVGYAVLPKLAARTGLSDDLAMVPLALPTVTRTLGVVTRKGEAISAASRHLLELMQSRLQADIDPMPLDEKLA